MNAVLENPTAPITTLSRAASSEQRPLVTVILPAYNEEALLRDHVSVVCHYLKTLESTYRWEVLVVNDGSSDRTGAIADELAREFVPVRVLHHPSNFGLGQALKFGFANSAGDYIVTLDVDLSYDVRHIRELLEKIRASRAKIVLASPYMKGGSMHNVPFVRGILSVLGNRFLSLFIDRPLSTLTSLVRVYDGPFIRSLDLRAMGMDIMPEMLYKAMVVRARIDETPGRLDWAPQLQYGTRRTSSIRILRHVNSTLLSGFVFRPFVFFIALGLLVAGFSTYVSCWMFVHFLDTLQVLESGGQSATWSRAFAEAYALYPHTFVTALLSALLAIQLLGLGVIALQNKRYFEDLYHLGSRDVRDLKKPLATEPQSL